jgi:hypothetical protein
MVRVPAFDFGGPNFVEPIDSTADVDFAALEIDVLPEQTAELGRPQPGEQCRQDQRAVSLRSSGDDAAQFIFCRHFDLRLGRLAALALADGTNIVQGDQTAAHGFVHERRQRCEYAAHHVARPTGIEELIAESVHRRDGQPR